MAEHYSGHDSTSGCGVLLLALVLAIGIMIGIAGVLVFRELMR